MNTSIKFRWLETTLSDLEYEQFLQKLWKIVSKREIITKSLYHLMNYESNTNQDNYTNKINESIAEIMELKLENERKLEYKIGTKCKIYSIASEKWCVGEIAKITKDHEGRWFTVRYAVNGVRKIKQIQKHNTHIKPINNQLKNINSDNTKSFSINEMSQELISKVASYLHIHDLPSFLYVNRYIYISCKSVPTTISSLMVDGNWIAKYFLNFNFERITKYFVRRATEMQQFSKVKNINLNSFFVPICGTTAALSLYSKNNPMISLSNVPPLGALLKQLAIDSKTGGVNNFKNYLKWMCSDINHLQLNEWFIPAIDCVVERRNIKHLTLVEPNTLTSEEEKLNIWNRIAANPSIQHLSLSKCVIQSGKIGSNVKIFDGHLLKCNEMTFLIGATNLQTVHWKLTKCPNQDKLIESVLKTLLPTLPSLNYLCIDAVNCRRAK
eukprot:103374_1